MASAACSTRFTMTRLNCFRVHLTLGNSAPARQPPEVDAHEPVAANTSAGFVRFVDIARHRCAAGSLNCENSSARFSLIRFARKGRRSIRIDPLRIRGRSARSSSRRSRSAKERWSHGFFSSCRSAARLRPGAAFCARINLAVVSSRTTTRGRRRRAGSAEQSCEMKDLTGHSRSSWLAASPVPPARFICTQFR